MAEETVRICPEGDRALLVDFGNVIDEKTNRKVERLAGLLKERTFSGIRELMPAFSSLLVLYHPEVTTYRTLKEQVETLLPKLSQDAKEGPKSRRIHHIPCCYGGAFGEDLPSMEELTGLTAKEIIQIHTKDAYRIYMLGFLPGFVYLGGLDSRIQAPRLATPRTKIPAGSVGIGGAQTGVYPIASPGGWRLIGRTPVRLYDPDRAEPILCRAGEYLRFEPVTEEEYHAIAKDVEQGTYQEEVTEQ
ncbi:MAG: 5-oxoprolinase subunit PxpB [Lachnospiraceae bacterium]